MGTRILAISHNKGTRISRIVNNGTRISRIMNNGTADPAD
jgi:hypothetical protein